MKNWSTDVTSLKKNPALWKLWKTEQLINFGLGKEKLARMYVKENFERLSIDPSKKTYLSFLIWGKKSSRQAKKSS